jgi:MFS family permease
LFTICSAAAALAPSIGFLVGARAIQGVGAAIATPLTLTLLAEAFPPERRGLALGIWSGISGIAVAIGPLVGGAVVQAASWQWIFWINVPVGIAVLPLRWTSAQVLASLIGGAALLVAFIAWEARAAAPMMPLSLFRSQGFSATSVAILFTNVGMFSVIFLVSQFLQSVLGYSPLSAGVHGLPWTAAPAVAAPIAGVLSDRLGGRRIVAFGIALQAIGIGWLAAMI